MAFPFKPSKRPYERNPFEPNGRGKWRKTAPTSQQNQLKASPGAIIFRVLCPSSKFGSIIGKGGEIVSKIRQETGARIRIEELVPGCDERVVVITGSDIETDASKEPTKEDNEETAAADGGEDSKKSVENDEDKQDSSVLEDLKPAKPTSSSQKALMLVYERLVDGEPEDGGGDEGSNKPDPISVRLVILSSQVGCILGEGGSVIKQMSSDSGAQIKILSKEELPSCVSSTDEIVQINGGIVSVRKALQSVSQQLLENPSRFRDMFPANNLSGPSSHQFPLFPRPKVLPPPNFIPHAQGPPFPNTPFDTPEFHSTFPPFPNSHEGPPFGKAQIPPETITYRLLCSNDKVGSVIGKGGNIVKTVKQETGCTINIHETTQESEDRIINISGPALPDDRISPAQDAVLRVQERIFLAAPDNRDNVPSRLLVNSNQIGCLIGKGGSIIAEMRKVSRAQIRILSKDQLPKSVDRQDEVVQVLGESQAVQGALIQITSRLKHHFFREKFPHKNLSEHHPVDQIPPFAPFMGRRELSPPRMFSNLPPFKNDSVGPPIDERSAFPHTVNNSALSHAVERMPPPPWAPQGMREGGGSMPLPDFPGAPPRGSGPFPGSQPAVITNSTVEVVVPRALVPSIYGEDGFCLRRIREISEAKITITEPRPEATETVILISGMPEQTHAAQSLLQAFVLSESGGP